MTSRPSAPPKGAATFVRSAAYLSLSLAVATALSGCPDGADLENPDRFITYDPPGAGAGGATGGAGGATGGTGGTAGVGGATGGTAGTMAQGGAAGTMATGGAAGTMTGIGGQLCDIQVALSKSCARTGCHSALDHYADLDLSKPEGIAAQMVGKPAMHGDINCAATGMPFRECMPNELPATCPQGALLIDPANFDNSWVVKKLNGDETCGDAMPLPPGDSAANGWGDPRKMCLIEFFRQLATSQ